MSDKHRKKRSELTEEQIRERRRRRKESAKKHRKAYWTTGKKVMLAICAVLLILIIAVVSVVASKMKLIKTVTLNPDELSINRDLGYNEEGYLNVALFGLDTRETDASMGTRSDTIMVASLNNETKELKLVSVYRDTLLQQDDETYNKANTAYSYGGAEEAIAMLNRNLDLDIRHYVTVDFSALVHVIDAVGGIEIEVTEEEIPYINGYAVEIIENTGVDTWAVTEPGYQTLTGVQATAYARIRYTTGDDFKRTERQRLVLTKIAEKLQQIDLGTLNTLIDKVFPMVETNFTLTEILTYAKDITKYQMGETVGFPYTVGTMSYQNAGDCVVPVTLTSNVKELHKFLFPGVSYTPSFELQDISSFIASAYNGEYYIDTNDRSYEEDEDYNEEYLDAENEDQSYGSNYGYGGDSDYDDSDNLTDEDYSDTETETINNEMY